VALARDGGRQARRVDGFDEHRAHKLLERVRQHADLAAAARVARADVAPALVGARPRLQ